VSSGRTILSPARFEALSDGVYAIAMTLLVLSLRVPDLSTGGADLLPGILRSLAKYATSFMLLAAFWVVHVHELHWIRRVDAPFLWAGLAGLFFVTLMPFSTSMVTAWPDATLAEILFHLNILALSAMLALQWLHVAQVEHLDFEGLSERERDLQGRLALLLPAYSFGAIILAPAADFESTFVYILMGPIFWLVKRAG
jgi:uncharacterized membrane protein